MNNIKKNPQKTQNDLSTPPTAQNRGSGHPDPTSFTANPPACGPDFQKLLLEKNAKPSEASLTSELDPTVRRVGAVNLEQWPKVSLSSVILQDPKTDLNKPHTRQHPPPRLPTPSSFRTRQKKGLDLSSKSILWSLSSCVFLWFGPVSTAIPLREKKPRNLPRSDGCGLNNTDGRFIHICSFLATVFFV